MKIRAVDFVTYNVSNYQKALAFYRDILGLKLSHEFGGQWAEFDTGNVTLAIGVWGKNLGPDGQKGGATVALAVDDLQATVAELRAKGLPIVEGPHETPVCHMVGVMDPDGNTIMFHQRKDGTAG